MRILSTAANLNASRRRPAIAFGIAPLLYFAAAFCVSLLGFVVLVEWRRAQGDTVTRATLAFHWLSHYGSLSRERGYAKLSGASCMHS